MSENEDRKVITDADAESAICALAASLLRGLSTMTRTSVNTEPTLRWQLESARRAVGYLTLTNNSSLIFGDGAWYWEISVNPTTTSKLPLVMIDPLCFHGTSNIVKALLKKHRREYKKKLFPQARKKTSSKQSSRNPSGRQVNGKFPKGGRL